MIFPPYDSQTNSSHTPHINNATILITISYLPSDWPQLSGKDLVNDAVAKSVAVRSWPGDFPEMAVGGKPIPEPGPDRAGAG
jgi:hypothetical protein